MFHVDPEFESYLPPMSPEEFTRLQANVVAEKGCRDPFVVWQEEDSLLDGHNRKRICDDNHLPYPKIVYLSFPNREEAQDWIDKNQLGKRNLNPDQASLLRGRVYNRVKQKHGGQVPKNNKGIAQNEPSLPKSTANTLAVEYHVSPAQIKRDGQFADAVKKLSIGAEVAKGTIKAPKQTVVKAAKALPENATPEQVKKARESLTKPPKAKVPKDAGSKGQKPVTPKPPDSLPVWVRSLNELLEALVAGLSKPQLTVSIADCRIRAAKAKQLFDKYILKMKG